jgi:hypothetical protein
MPNADPTTGFAASFCSKKSTALPCDHFIFPQKWEEWAIHRLQGRRDPTYPQ